MFNDRILIRSQQIFRSYHHIVFTEEVNQIALSSNDNKRIQTFDKVTTFPYGTNAFKVCEGEILSKNELNEFDEDIDIDTDTGNIMTEDIGINKDNTKVINKDNTKDNTADIDKDNTDDKGIIRYGDKDKTTSKTKTRTRNVNKKEPIKTFVFSKIWGEQNYEDPDWIGREIVLIFWNNGCISEICQKWIRYNGTYAYTRFEELCRSSGKVLFTRKHKASLSKKESHTYIDIDELPMFKDFSSINDIEIKTKTKTKTEIETEKIMLDRINKKISAINKLNDGLAKIKVDVTKKIVLIYESIYELQDEIYSDDSWLRLVELNKIDAIIDKALNVVWNVICGKNRINPEKIKIDKHKDIDGYVSKLTDVVNNKIVLVYRMCGAIYLAMSEIKNETNLIDEKINKSSEMDNVTLRLIHDRLKELINKSRKNLNKILV